MRPWGLGAIMSAMLVAGMGGAAEPDLTGHQPRFSLVESGKGRFWVCDGTEKVALFGGSSIKGDSVYAIGFLRAYPGQELPASVLAEPDVVDFVSCQRARLTTFWMNQALGNVTPVMKAAGSDPACLKINLTATKNTDVGRVDIAFRFDAALRRYVIDLAYDLTLAEKGGGEFLNFYPNGAGDLRPDVGKYDRLLWDDDQGQRWAHYMSAVVPSPFQIRFKQSSMFAYVDEGNSFSAVFFESFSPQVKSDICLCWFDGHMIWTEPEGRMPPYHYRAKVKSYWLTPEESKAALAQAKVVPINQFATMFSQYIPIQMNAVNDLEAKADLNTPSVKHIYFPLQPDNGIVRAWDDTVAHSGTHSIRLERTTAGKGEFYLHGPELLVTPGRRLTVTAWVKTENLQGGEGFWLQSGFACWNGKDVAKLGGPYLSRKLTGTNDWTKISIDYPVTPTPTPWLDGRITFCFDGKGKLWLDDLEFSEK